MHIKLSSRLSARVGTNFLAVVIAHRGLLLNAQPDRLPQHWAEEPLRIAAGGSVPSLRTQPAFIITQCNNVKSQVIPNYCKMLANGSLSSNYRQKKPKAAAEGGSRSGETERSTTFVFRWIPEHTSSSEKVTAGRLSGFQHSGFLHQTVFCCQSYEPPSPTPPKIKSCSGSSETFFHRLSLNSKHFSRR